VFLKRIVAVMDDALDLDSPIPHGIEAYSEVPDRFAVIRDSDLKVLGNVGTRYVPFQNEEAFTFMDNLVDSGEAKYETAGSLRGGKVIFISMKVPRDILIGGEDAVELYLLLRTSHDGTKAISVYVTPIRVVCMNTLALATYGTNVKQRWSVTHIGTAAQRLAEARDTLDLTFRYVDEFEREANQLLETQITDDTFERLLYRILPDRPKTPDVVDSIFGIYRESSTVRYPGTAWGALNAITEYTDWGRRTTSAEARFTTIIDGEAAKLRNSASSLLLTL
jgi:phage/plasmid-like protein (TIGR03299 family)